MTGDRRQDAKHERVATYVKFVISEDGSKTTVIVRVLERSNFIFEMSLKGTSAI